MSSDRQSRYLTAMLSTLIASVLLYLAVPRIIAEFIAWPGDAVLSRLQEKEEVSQADLKLMVESLNAALKWQYSSRRQSNVSIAELLLAERLGTAIVPDAAMLETAMKSARASLFKAVARPYIWTWLAYVEKIQNGPSEKVASFLEMSIGTGHHERHLVLSRMALSFEVWQYLSLKLKDRVYEQVRLGFHLLWGGTRERFVAIVLDNNAEEIVREAFSQSPKDLQMFENNLLSVRRSN